MEPRSRGQHAGLDRAVVLDAAHRLCAERGVDRLSMRSLAARLGVAPTALYNHVRDKDDLLEAILDDALEGIGAPGDLPPRERLEAIMTSTYDVLISRRDLVPLFVSRHGARGPNAMALGEEVTAALSAAGLTAERANRALRVLVASAIGLASYDVGRADPRAARAAYLDLLRWSLDGILGAAG